MIVFFVVNNLCKPKRRTLIPLALALHNTLSSTRSFSEKNSTPEMPERFKDHAFDKYSIVERKMQKVLKLQQIIYPKEKKTLSIAQLDNFAQRAGFEPGTAGEFMLRYPHIFEVYEHPVHRVLYCRLTRKALAQISLERRALFAQIPQAVTRLRKLLMMSYNGRVRFEHVNVSRREFGLPENFKDTVILAHPQYFRLIIAKNELRTRYIECVKRDESLCVCAVEKARESEYRLKGVESEDTRFAFMMSFPGGYRIWNLYRVAIWQWQRVPYWSPYEDISGYDMRSLEAKKRWEKRMVASIHELLSITVEKRLNLEKIAYFKIALNFPLKSMLEFLLRHQGIFYVLARGNSDKAYYGKTYTVFLREAYRKGNLLESNDLYLARRRLSELVLMGRKMVKYEDGLAVGFRNFDDDGIGAFGPLKDKCVDVRIFDELEKRPRNRGPKRYRASERRGDGLGARKHVVEPNDEERGFLLASGPCPDLTNHDDQDRLAFGVNVCDGDDDNDDNDGCDDDDDGDSDSDSDYDDEIF